MKWTLYNKQTGEFSAIITGPDETCLVGHVTEETGAKEGRWRRNEHKVVDGEIVPINNEE